MVRRTKEESAATRRAIIEAARNVFDAHGVSRTSLEDIAAAAGVTRGAIYWHFANKADLFYAMRDESHVPLVDLSNAALEASDPALDPLDRVQNFLLTVMAHVTSDEIVECTFRVANFKCEYVDEFAHDLDMACTKHTELVGKLTKVYRKARRQDCLRDGLSPTLAATDTMLFITGLVRTWLFDDQGLLVRKHARQLIIDHVEGKRKRDARVAA
jgi:TetR/AcrR family transcriptional regulator, acrAB operon repressor